VLGKPIVLVTADHQNKAISKYRADYYKLMAETSRINAGTRWYSRLALALICLMVVAVVKFLL